MKDKKWMFWLGAAGLALLGLGYFVFPADAIPDFIALIGQLDDLVVNLITLAGIVVNVCLALGWIPLEKKEAEFSGYYDEYI